MWLKVVVVIYLVYLVGVRSQAVIEAEDDPDWWRHAVFYQIYPRSFKDNNNDGIGDLQGIISKLEYLKEAGVTGAWLSPIYKSPQVDQGYDISDFVDIQPEFGTLDDFAQLVAKAKELGLKVIMDFVPNHSSDQHEWFLKSVQGVEGYKDYYVWADAKDGKEPSNWLSVFKYSAWKWNEQRQQYYLHQFAEQQPDLNFRNPTVRQEMKNVLKFWLDKGIDGFRVDAVPFVYENEELLDEPRSFNPSVTVNDSSYLNHTYTQDLQETFDLIYDWRDFLDQYTLENGGSARIMMTEVYTNVPNTMRYMGDGDREGAHFTFNFFLLQEVRKDSNAADVIAAIRKWTDNVPAGKASNWVLGNHDNTRAATRLGPENVDGFNMLAAVLPGIQVTYNGEEIGQENGEVTWEQGKDPGACNGNMENFNSSSRDFERTPFQWDNSTNAGFNEGAEPWLPVSKKYLQTNLAAQDVPGLKSHFNIYKELLKLRREYVFIHGNLSLANISDVIIITRSVGEMDSSTFLMVFNLGEEEVQVNLTSFAPQHSTLNVAISSVDSTKHKGDKIDITRVNVKPHESFVAKATNEFAESSATITVLSINIFTVGLMYLVRSF